MLRRVFLSLALGLAASCAQAQTAPSPADVGISKGSPDVFKLKGHDNAWTPFGTVDPSTHVYVPGTNGAIAPNDCIKWGPGLTSAGAACNSVTGGAHPANQLTIYTNHAGLVANVTTPTEAWTVQQQGFYAPGDGGAAAYQWSFTSYCVGGTSGSPTAADGIGCILPIGQSASTGGRYLLQFGNGLDVRQIGMVGDGVTDNYPLVATLIGLLPQGQSSHVDVLFPPILGQYYTDYRFSKSFHVNRSMNIRCQGLATGGGDSSTRLVFAAGMHGVVFDNAIMSPDGTGFGGGGINGCGVIGTSYHEGFHLTAGSSTLTSVAAEHTYGAWDFQAGDGVIVYQFTPVNGGPANVIGSVVATANSGTHSLTLNPASPPAVATGSGYAIWRMPVAQAYTVNTTSGSSTVTVTGGPDLLRPGDYVWSDAFPFGTVVMKTSGTVGAQTITMGTYPLEGFTEQNATANHTGGKLWVIPAAIKMHVQTSLHNNYISSFGIGLEMECSSWTVPGPSGCNGSMAQENTFTFNVIGRLVVGDNAGASTSIMNIYAYEALADVIEAGAVGSTYYNENTNSQEASTSIYGIVGLCVNSNSSSFFGGYNTSTGGYCMNQWGVPTTTGGRVVFMANQATVPDGAPAMVNGNFGGLWYFLGNDTGGTQLCMNKPNAPLSWSHGNVSCGGPSTWNVAYDSRGFWNGSFSAS